MTSLRSKASARVRAVICNQPSIVKYLIEQGAEVNAKNKLGVDGADDRGGLYIANAHKTSPAPQRFCAQRWPWDL